MKSKSMDRKGKRFWRLWGKKRNITELVTLHYRQLPEAKINK